MRTRFRKELKRFACLGLAAVVSATTVPVDFGRGRNVLTVEAASTSNAQQELVTRFKTKVYDVFSNAKSTYSTEITDALKTFKDKYGTAEILGSLISTTRTNINNVSSDIIDRCQYGIKAGDIAGHLEKTDLETVDTYLSTFIRLLDTTNSHIDTKMAKLKTEYPEGTANATYNANMKGLKKLRSIYDTYKSSAQDALISLKAIKGDLVSVTSSENTKYAQSAYSYLNKGINIYKGVSSKINALKNSNFKAYFAGSVAKDTVDSQIYIDNLYYANENFATSISKNNKEVLDGDLEILKAEVEACRDRVSKSATFVDTLQNWKEYSSLDADIKKSALEYATYCDGLVEQFAICLDNAKSELNKVITKTTQTSPVKPIDVSTGNGSYTFSSYKDYTGKVWIDVSSLAKSGYRIDGVTNKATGKFYAGSYVGIPADDLGQLVVSYTDYCNVYIDYNGGKDSSGNIGNVKTFHSSSVLKTESLTKTDYPATNGNLELNALSDIYSGNRASYNARLSSIDLDVYERDNVYLQVLWYDKSSEPTATPSVKPTTQNRLYLNPNGGYYSFGGQKLDYPMSETPNSSGKVKLESNSSLKKDGYKFKCWNTKADGTGTNYYTNESVTVNGEMTLYAIWEEDIHSTTYYTVKFNMNGGYYLFNGEKHTSDLSINDLIPEGKSFTVNTTYTPLRDGYTFKYWNSKADGTGTIYANGSDVIIKSDMYLYAIWEKNTSSETATPSNNPVVTPSNNPVVTPSNNPVVTTSPTTSSNPTTSATPSQTPNVTVKPSFSEKPTYTVEPIYTVPSVPTSEPTSVPVVPVAPSVSETPSVAPTATSVVVVPDPVLPNDPSIVTSQNPLNTPQPIISEKPSATDAPVVTVAPTPVPIKISNKKVTLGKGEKFKLSVTNVKGRKVVYTSSNSNVSVSSKGVVTAKKTGSAKVYIVCDGKKLTVNFNVKKAPKSVKFKVKKLTLKKGQSKKLVVVISKGYTSNKLTWKSTNSKVVSVKNGKITAKKKGSAVITVKTFNGKKSKIQITVK